MKKSVVAVGVVVAACAAYLGAAAAIGHKVEKNVRAMSAAAQAEWPTIRLTDERYERGLFSATHTVTLRVGCDAPDAAASAPREAITIVQHVKVGPLPGFKGLGAATIDTEVAMDAATRRQLAKVFGTEQPFLVHTDVALSGASHTHFSIARFHETGAKGEQVDFQGLTGDVDNNDSALEYDIRMPAFSVADAASAPAGVALTVKGAHMHARAEGTGDLALRPSKSQGEMALMEMAMPMPGQPAAHKVTLSKFKFTQDTTIDKNLLNAVGHVEGVGQIDDTKLDRIEMQATMKHFDVVAYRSLMRRLVNNDPSTCGKAPDPAKLMASPEFQSGLVQVLAANPEVSMDKLVVEIEGKRAELAYALGVNGFTAEDAKQPLMMSLMTRAYANAHVKLPEDWVQKSLVYFAQQGGKASGAGDQAAMAELMLGKVIDQGYVVREEGMLRSEAAFKGGQATINGKPLGRPAGGAAENATAAPM
jgi:uncharacterized protein YdgA (DUF945 family)